MCNRMNYIKKDSKIYELTERECSIEDLEFHIVQLREQILKLENEIKEMKKL